MRIYVHAHKKFVAILAYNGFVGICSGTSEPEKTRIGLHRHHPLPRRVSKLPCLVLTHSIAAVEPTFKSTNPLSCTPHSHDVGEKRDFVALIGPVQHQGSIHGD